MTTRDLATKKCLTAWTDPKTGVRSYLLSAHVAPQQQGFYFVNQSMSEDGRFLWFYCSFPPSGDAAYGRTLGVYDLEADELRHFPETQFCEASPLVDVKNGDIYWCSKAAFWRRGPRQDSPVEHIATLPEEWRSKGVGLRMATHLTFSADRSELGFDAQIGKRSYVGSVSLSTGKFELWQEFDRFFDHGQFSPTDQNLMLLAQDFWMDLVTGEPLGIDHDAKGGLLRIWTIRRGEKARPVTPKWDYATHEWWSVDGKAIYYIEGRGIGRVNLATNERTVASPSKSWHGQSTRDDRYFVADTVADPTGWYRGCAAEVSFYNSATKKRVIVAHLPALNTRENPSIYHPDPHPHFVARDSMVVYTTTVMGRLDVALTPVEALVAATS